MTELAESPRLVMRSPLSRRDGGAATIRQPVSWRRASRRGIRPISESGDQARGGARAPVGRRKAPIAVRSGDSTRRTRTIGGARATTSVSRALLARV